MDILSSIQQYISEMVRLAGPGMKVLLMDKETTSIISCAFAQSEMMQKEVFLFERIDSNGVFEPIRFLKCIVFVRPTPENIQLLSDELRSPRFGQYYICVCKQTLDFSNIISKSDIKILAECDEQEVVREVREFYADIIPLAPYLAALNIPNVYENSFNMSVTTFKRCLQAIIGTLLATNKKPVIRYQKSSKDANRLADEIGKLMNRDDTLFSRCNANSLLLIIDRSEDPVSPLLNQWTYEAMVHELIGLDNNRVAINDDNTTKYFVLSPQHDDFYLKNRYLNFGDIGQNIKILMNEYQKKAQIHQNLESIADMKKFVDQYPQFKKISGTIAKHVQIVGELSKIVAQQNLLEVSELEQNIAVANGEHGFCLNFLKKLLQDSKTTDLNALRLSILYALRFEGTINCNLNAVLEVLSQRQEFANKHYAGMIKAMLDYGGVKRRQADIFGNRSAVEMTKRFIRGLKGVENIYTQHEPYIVQLIDQAARGKLPETIFNTTDLAHMNTRFENIILFVIGGCTYEESAAVHMLNTKKSTVQPSQGLKVLLCSNYVHNFKSFIKQLSTPCSSG